ncbi:hypothetical protein EI94DRAFT_199468 [Lactarius quietus]|nr:hypothetical protein EI94DRAFT_199468 [Lactarius quietus]
MKTVSMGTQWTYQSSYGPELRNSVAQCLHARQKWPAPSIGAFIYFLTPTARARAIPPPPFRERRSASSDVPSRAIGGIWRDWCSRAPHMFRADRMKTVATAHTNRAAQCHRSPIHTLVHCYGVPRADDVTPLCARSAAAASGEPASSNGAFPPPPLVGASARHGRVTIAGSNVPSQHLA